MKYLKIFEDFESKFKVGDYVYCIDYNNSKLEPDVKFQIIDIYKKYDFYYLKLKEYPLNQFKEDRFISEIEYNANKYNL